MKVEVESRRRKMMVAGIFVVALACQGCVSVKPIRTTGGSSTESEPGFAESISDRLNVKVSAEASSGGREGSIVAERIREQTEQRLVADGFKIDASQPDVEIATKVDVELFDKSGNYYLYKGDSETVVKRTHDANVIGRTTISEKGERQLGQADAAKALGKALGAKTAGWVGKTVKPAAVGVSVTKLRIDYSWTKWNGVNYSNKFTSRVGGLKGVVSCRQLSHDYKKKEMVFRIAYYADNFPSGLLNHLISMPALDMKPKK